MIFQNSHKPASSSQSAVKRTNWASSAIFHTFAHIQSASLILSAVRSRSKLTVTSLRWNPSFTIKLTSGRRTKVTCSSINNAVRHFHLSKHFLLHTEQLLMLSARIFLLAINEHLNLIELMHTNNTGSILSSSTSLTTVAARPTAITQSTIA